MQDNQQAIKIVTDLILEHQTTVFTEGKVQHNQQTLTQLIDLYVNSKYEDAPDDANGVVFYNIINKDLINTNKKTDIDRKNLMLSIKDKVMNFLMNAGNAEFKEDYDMGTFLNDFKEDYNKYGTSVLKLKYVSKKDSVVEVIPWSSVICNPNSWASAPQAIRKEVRLIDVLENPLYNTEVMAGELENHEGATVMSYELHGDLPKYVISGNMDDKERQPMQVIYLYIPPEFMADKRKNEGGKWYVVALTPEKENPLRIVRRKKVVNRTMGGGVPEASLEAQIVSNEVANLMIDELRSVAKIVRWSDDQELDGVDLGEIDNNTIINVAPGKNFGQVQANTVAFGELQNYLNQWGVQNQDETGTQDISLGKAGKSGTPFRSSQLQSNEVDSQHAQEREKMALHIEKMYKDVFLKIVIDYMDTKKDITDLLTGEQLQDFYMFLADRLAERAQVQAVLERKPPIEDRELLVRSVLAQVQDTDYKIVDLDTSWDRERLIDKTRVLTTGEQKDIDAKIATLTALHAQVAANPQAYPNLDANDILGQIVELTDSESLISLFKQTKQAPQQQQELPQVAPLPPGGQV